MAQKAGDGRSYIKSPINYTGNKFRLLTQFEPYLPEKCETFVDLFCGGATVGINMDAEKIIMIDNNPRVVSLLRYLATQDLQTLLARIEEVIEEYGLTYSAKNGYKAYRGERGGNNGLKELNKAGYYQLRDDYNALEDKESDFANVRLYVLMAYGFNNDLRFNRQGEFNLPVGKTDFNKNNLKKIMEYNTLAKQKKIEFVCAEYDAAEVKEMLLGADFVYADPPYLITTAVYNEGGNWEERHEEGLVELLDELDRRGVKFALSNVLAKAGSENGVLKGWLERNPQMAVHEMDYHYRSCSYNKKDRDAHEREVLITN